MTEQHYCLGFAFLHARTHVVLIRKRRPKWQFGKVNGVGGHVEEGELAIEAMRREFREETGVDVEESRWTQFGVMGAYEEWSCDLFRTELRAGTERPESKTDEEVLVASAFSLPLEVIPNLRWIVPAALDEEAPSLRVRYGEVD